MAGARQMENFTGWACSLRLQLSLDKAQTLQLLQKRIHLAHFKMHNLPRRAALELLKHLITVHRMHLEQTENNIFGWLANLHTIPSPFPKKNITVIARKRQSLAVALLASDDRAQRWNVWVGAIPRGCPGSIYNLDQ